MKKTVVFVLFTVLLLTQNSFSFLQGGKVLSLKECVNIALNNNYRILQARNNIELQESNVKAAIGTFLPNLNINGNWNGSSREYKQETEQIVGGVPIKIPISGKVTSNSYSTSISSSITIFDGFSNINRLNSAQSSVLSSDYDLKRTEQTIILQVYNYYFNVLRTQKIYKQKQEVLAYSKGQLDKMVESEKLGAVSRANVYQQQAQVASDELALIQAENDFDKAKSDLVAYLALNTLQNYDFEDPAVKTEIDSTDYEKLKSQLSDYNSLFKKAVEYRPDYKSTVENLNVAEYSLNISRSGLFPTIGASISYGLNANEINKITDNKSWSYGINISFPIFSRFQTDNSIEQAKVNLKNAEIMKRENERTIQVEIKKAILDLDAAYKSYIAAKRNVKFQKENMDIIQEKYNLGSSTLLDLLYATNNYNSAEVSMINATYQYLAAVKQTEYALGTISE
ncbi:MAG TPA: TolC family protein [Ignavibacteria bacterium]|jgi:outer membrane protein